MIKYTCEHCQQEFEDETSEEEKQQEAIANFGNRIPEEEQVSLCDDCYNLLIPLILKEHRESQ